MDVIGCEIQLNQLFVASLFYLSDPNKKKLHLEYEPLMNIRRKPIKTSKTPMVGFLIIIFLEEGLCNYINSGCDDYHLD